MIADNVVVNSRLREDLANLCHDQWSNWTKYLFDKCVKNSDGTLTIPLWAVERWSKQFNTDYKQLSESEMDSDRTEADKFIDIIAKYQ